MNSKFTIKKSHMITRIISIIIMLLLGTYGYAQVNPHFDDPPGAPVGGSSPYTFNGFPGNWQRSHGSPKWSPSFIGMWAGSNGSTTAGEGLYQDNALLKIGKYKINVGIRSAPNGNGKIRVLAANGLTPNTGIGTGSSVPVVPHQLIGEWSSYVPALGYPVVNWLVDDEFYNPYPNGQIWIYPLSDSDYYYQYDCIIDWVTICRIIDDGVTYSSGVLPYSSYYRRFFRIGSSFPAGSGVVQNQMTAYTDYEASEYIDIRDNVSISVQAGVYFLAQITPEKCIAMPGNEVPGNPPPPPPPPPPCPPPCPTASRPSNNASTNASENPAILLHPNPNNGNFTLTMPEVNNYEIIVINLIGSKVYEQKVVGQQQVSIQLNNRLSSGSYFIEVRGARYNKKIKFMVIK